MSKLTNQDEIVDLLTVHQVAAILRCDDTTVRRWIKHGTLPAVSLPHVGKRQAYRVKQSELDRILHTSAA